MRGHLERGFLASAPIPLRESSCTQRPVCLPHMLRSSRRKNVTFGKTSLLLCAMLSGTLESIAKPGTGILQPWALRTHTR